MEIGGWDGSGEGERGDLSQRMHAGIGAAGALGKDALAHGAMDGIDQQTLDGGEAGLDLPAVKRCAVVRERELPVSHLLFCTVSRGSEFAFSGIRCRIVMTAQEDAARRSLATELPTGSERSDPSEN
jgi:hypothetical protein